MSRRIGVFGGTFDPIHIGHLAAVQDAADALDLERVLFVPNSRPPHKAQSPVSPAADRVAMVKLSLEDNPEFELSMVEFERDGPSYTLDTMRVLRRQFGPDTELYFLTGCDALGDLHTWHRPQELLDEFRVVIMDRPTGSEVPWSTVEERFPDIRRQVQVVHVAQLEISGADLRCRVRGGRSIRYYVVPAVDRYITDHGLYRDAPDPSHSQISHKS
jgi:nicotinate-nucleotide adenylyltransferase